MVVQSVEADYSQFYLRGDDPIFHEVDGEFFADTGLASADGSGSVIFVSFQQNGPIPVDVEIQPGEPEPLGLDWQDVVEITLEASGSSTLSGWEATAEDLRLPLEPGRNYRLRYAVADADRSRERWEAPLLERYQIRLWPAPPAPPTIVRSESGSGQYWLFQDSARRAYAQMGEVPVGSRTLAMIDFGLSEHRRTAERIARGEESFRSGILAYTQKVFPAELEYQSIISLIDERARGWLGAHNK